LTVLAFVWSIGLLVAALLAPAYGSATLVDENGTRVLVVIAVPAVISAAVWLALRRKCTRGGPVSGVVAWTCVSLLAVFCLLALASIGMFVMPVAVLLAWAVSVTPPG
jgi:amino acid permease